MYARVPPIVSGGSGAWRSRGSFDAKPKPVSQTTLDVGSTIQFRRLYVLMNNAAFVEALQRGRKPDGDAQGPSQFQRLREKPI
jgi:hypothetical protein